MKRLTKRVLVGVVLAGIIPCMSLAEETVVQALENAGEIQEEKVMNVKSGEAVEDNVIAPVVPEVTADVMNEKPVVLAPTIVTASTMEMSLSEVVSSITVITAEMIEARKAQNLKEILQGVAGIDLAQNGGPGQLGSIFIRGAASERTLVLINGVPLNDPMSPAGNTDISRISLDNVKQIEIVRGPQSVVFGSGAMGGVVNIITQRGPEDAFLTMTAEGGKYGSWLGKLQAGGAWAGLAATVGASLEGTEGFSAARHSDDFVAAQPVPAMEDDGFRNLTLDVNLDYSAVSDLLFSLTNRLIRAMTEIDAYGGDYGDDPNFVSAYTQTAHRFDAVYQVFPDVWKTRMSAGLSQLDRVTNNDFDTDHPFDMTRSEYRSRTLTLDWHNQLDVMAGNHLALGVGYQQEQGMFNYYSEYLDYYTFMSAVSENNFAIRSTHTTGIYLEDQYTWEGLVVNAGVRYDEHDQYGGHTTYRVTPSYRLADWGTRVKATYGTAFNAPSLYQLYVEDIYSQGNPALEPETSMGWDIGVEQKIMDDKIMVSAAYFQTTYENQIDAPFDATVYKYVYTNLGKTETKGWEVEISVEPWDDLVCKIVYTKLTANDLTHEDTIGPEPLIRRADYQVAADILYTFQKASAALHVGHVGPRWDSGKKELESYTLLDMVLRYQAMPQAQVYVKLQNMLDEDYVEVSGYTTARFAAYAGIKIDL